MREGIPWRGSQEKDLMLVEATIQVGNLVVDCTIVDFDAILLLVLHCFTYVLFSPFSYQK
jgi:hypothetical protein